MFYRAPDFHRVSLTHSVTLNVTATPEQKAKDWDVLEIFCKMDRVEGPKVHLWKLGHGGGAICDRVRLMLLVVTETCLGRPPAQ